MTADATTARYGMGVVFLNTWQTKEENGDTKEKREGEPLGSPSPVRLPLNLHILTTEFSHTADHVVLRPQVLNDLKTVLLLCYLLGCETTCKALAPRGRQSLTCKVTILEGSVGEHQLGKLFACFSVDEGYHSCLGAVGFHEHAEAG